MRSGTETPPEDGSLMEGRDCGWCHGTGIHYYNTDDMDRLTMPCPNRDCPKSPDWWHKATDANEEADEGPIPVPSLREADEAASVAHDFIWGKNGVTKEQASVAIWIIHAALRPLIDEAKRD